MGANEKPCCAADALRRIRQIEIGGIVVGIAMLDSIIEEVNGLNLAKGDEIADELLKRVKVSNYVPKAAETKYRDALLREYLREVK
ncbi:MAG: hypothetical protein QHG99_02145 [Methanomicrobiales archaeon]|nr:hypothetical protein [Methanomicrobiales archaeon]